MADIFTMTLEDRLYRTRYEPDSDHPHIRVDNALCGPCADKPCVQICPARVYKRDPNDEAHIIVSHDNCLECGSCVQVCPTDSLAWTFPDGGAGVKYRFG